MHGKIIIDDLVANIDEIEVKVIDFKDCRLLIWKIPKESEVGSRKTQCPSDYCEMAGSPHSREKLLKR